MRIQKSGDRSQNYGAAQSVGSGRWAVGGRLEGKSMCILNPDHEIKNTKYQTAVQSVGSRQLARCGWLFIQNPERETRNPKYTIAVSLRSLRLLGRFLCGLGCLAVLISSCTEEPKKQAVVVDSKKLKENIVNVNKPAVVMENDEINAWIKSHAYPMKSTGTGLRYYIFKENKTGKEIKLKNQVKLKYKVSLLDGTVCYTSDQKGPRTFLVGADNIETGLHEGVQLMREGEKALFILPSHLAFGLIGDRDKIPPKASVVYEIEVLEVK